MILSLLQNSPWVINNWQGILAAILLVGAAWIVLRSRGREETHKTESANVAALNALLGTRDKQLTAAADELIKKQKELEIITSEYKQIVQVDITELVKAWQKHSTAEYLLENARLRQQIEELTIRLAQHEKV